MRKSELRGLIAEYKALKLKYEKNSQTKSKSSEKLKDIEHRYFHETVNSIESI